MYIYIEVCSFQGMRYGVLVLLAGWYALTLFAPFVGAEHSNRMTVEADVLAPIVRVQVPDLVSFGNVTPGFVSQRQKIIVNNTGTTAVEITPELLAPDPIFSRLVVARRTTEQFQPIGSFKMTIARPRALGGSEDDFFYAKLDLSTYPLSAVPEDKRDHRATVVVWAVAA